MASSPIEDPAHTDHRAKIRVGVAVALLVTAIAILVSLGYRKSARNEAAEDAPPGAQERISSIHSPPPSAAQTTTDTTAVNQPTDPEARTPASGSAAGQDAPLAPPPPPVSGKLPPAPAITATSGPNVSVEAPAAGKQAQSAPTGNAATAAQTAKPAAAKEFEVQLGVFSDMENAKQLQARLDAYGIRTHTETRVQLGPFKTRAEADAAREKIKALGIATPVLVAK